MLSPVFLLALAAAPVELTVVHAVQARTTVPQAKSGTQKNRAYSVKLSKRTVSTAFIDAEGKVHVQCEQHAFSEPHAHNNESKQ